jgi:hypothetical protein
MVLEIPPTPFEAWGGDEYASSSGDLTTDTDAQTAAVSVQSSYARYHSGLTTAPEGQLLATGVTHGVHRGRGQQRG